jgi:hypothetical protein
LNAFFETVTDLHGGVFRRADDGSAVRREIIEVVWEPNAGGLHARAIPQGHEMRPPRFIGASRNGPGFVPLGGDDHVPRQSQQRQGVFRAAIRRPFVSIAVGHRAHLRCRHIRNDIYAVLRWPHGGVGVSKADPKRRMRALHWLQHHGHARDRFGLAVEIEFAAF